MDLAESYSHVPYAYQCFAQTQPTRLGAWARLAGLDVASPAAARVLEIGSGPGMNLFAMTAEHPSCEAIGTDIHQPSIDRGNSIAASSGLTNLRFVCHDFSIGSAELGAFDYVIAHGVLSWIPLSLRPAFFAAARGWLGARGVLYVNFNVRPGFGALGELRTLLLHLTRREVHHGTRIARARKISAAIAESMTPKTAQQAALREAAVAVAAMTDSRLAHDLLEPEGGALGLEEVTQLAAASGLRLLGSTFDADSRPSLSPAADETLSSLPVEPEDAPVLRDFVSGRSYREVLLARDDAPLASGLPKLEVCAPIRFHSPDGTTMAAPPAGNAPVHFSGFSSQRGGTDRPVHKALLALLARAWPSSVDSVSLATRVAETTGTPSSPELRSAIHDFLVSLNRTRLVDLRLTRVEAAPALPERPRVLRALRAQLALGDSVWSLHHIARKLTSAERPLVLAMDGSRSSKDLARLEGTTEERVLSLLQELQGLGFLLCDESEARG